MSSGYSPEPRRRGAATGVGSGVGRVEELGEQRGEVVAGGHLVRRVGPRRRGPSDRPAPRGSASSSPLTSYLPISEATSPSARCASFSLLDQPGQHPQVAGEPLAGRVEQQRGDPRRVLLPVPVDAAVALLDPDQAPRDVVVDQLVALGVQVDALGGDVAGDQHPDRRVLLLERLDDPLLLVVGQAAVQDLDRLGSAAPRSFGSCSCSHPGWRPARRTPPPGRRSPGRRRSRAGSSTSAVVLRRGCRQRDRRPAPRAVPERVRSLIGRRRLADSPAPFARRSISRSAAGEDRNALASVHGNSDAFCPEYGARAGRREQPDRRPARRRPRSRPARPGRARCAVPAARPSRRRPRWPPRGCAGAGG